MKQANKDRFHSNTMARSYDKMCQLLVPGYDFMHCNLIDILKFEKLEKIILLDLGAGSGILIEKVLKEFPDSTCYYLDYSDEFTSLAKIKLKEYKNRVTYIKSDFCGDWESKIKEKPNVITSMSAIHHLSNKNKKNLYKKCYNILEENGWFFNIDEMKTINEDAYLRSLYHRIYHAENQKNIVSENLKDAYKGYMEKIGDWKKRNIDNINLPKQEGDDIHESFLIQLNWLNDAGFKETDLYCKLFLLCMIGGKKI